MNRRIVLLFLLLISVRPQTSLAQTEIPKNISGVELSNLGNGWFANRYPWMYSKRRATVHPHPTLWTPESHQTPSEIREDCHILNQHGAVADVWLFNPYPGHSDYNYWLSVQGIPECDSRKFFLLYEHIGPTAYVGDPDGRKNMDLEVNREVWRRDIDFLVRKMILPNQKRYIVINGKAVIYLWATGAMYGNFVSLLDEARTKYPVAFIGSPGVMAQSEEELPVDSLLKSLDGFMEYAIVLPSYNDAVKTYIENSRTLRRKINSWKTETKRDYVFLPMFQFAFDDSRWPGRTTPQMYPTSKEEVEKFALQVLKATRDGVFDIALPFVIWSEIYEGTAAIPSLCMEDNKNTPTRFVGCGTERLELVQKFFRR